MSDLENDIKLVKKLLQDDSWLHRLGAVWRLSKLLDETEGCTRVNLLHLLVDFITGEECNTTRAVAARGLNEHLENTGDVLIGAPLEILENYLESEPSLVIREYLHPLILAGVQRREKDNS